MLVIEAGGDKSNDPFVVTPGLMTGLYGKEEYDWDFGSTPQVRGSCGASFEETNELTSRNSVNAVYVE